MSIGDFDHRQAASDSGEGAIFPSTLLQKHLWRQNEKHGPYGLNVAMRWQVEGRLSHTTAQAALQSLVQRHEILRTSFRQVDGNLAQVVWPACTLKLRDIDLSFLAPGDIVARAEEIAKSEATEPMDPREAPLLRATMLRFGPDRGVLLLTLHSMVADGWSIGLLMREFRAAACAIDSGKRPDTSAPDLQFADYALWEKQLLASDALDEARAFWRRQLREVSGTQVLPDVVQAAAKDHRAEISTILLPGTFGHAIEVFARQHNATLYSIATAALGLMLHRVTGDPEIVIGSQVANREEPAAEGLVGPTVNSITLRLPIDTTVELRRFVKTAAETVQEALQHQRLPFEIAAGYAPDQDGKPLHSINLVVHRSYSGITETERDEPAGFSLISLPSHSSGPLWDLNYFMIGRDDGWRISCEAKAGLYGRETVQALLQAWRECLEALVTSADRRLADCPTLRGIGAGNRAPNRPPAARHGEDGGSIPVHDPARQIVCFHEGGSSTPVIMLNNRSVYYQLARQLGENRPFIDIQLYDPAGPLELPSHAFEVFAAYAVRLIRWAQPRGPYILGGHCVYGALAFEAARQLQRSGEQIELVALFDSWAPGYRESMSPRDQRRRQWRLRREMYARRLREYRSGEIGLNEIVRKPILRRLGLLGPDPAPEKLPGQWFDDYLREAVTRYRPRPYDGTVALFRSKETLRGRLFEELMGWGPLVAGDLRKLEVNSAHLDMFRDRPAGQIADFMRAILAGKEGR